MEAYPSAQSFLKILERLLANSLSQFQLIQTLTLGMILGAVLKVVSGLHVAAGVKLLQESTYSHVHGTTCPWNRLPIASGPFNREKMEK
jgi:hypothetical protein